MFNFKRNNIDKNIISETYQNIVERSRAKFFYLQMDIEDSFESRFDLIILHAFLIFYYLKKLDENKNDISQPLFDFMFADFDNNLREMGFGDIAVNKKMKVFITAFYGRISQYSKGINEIENLNDDNLIKKTINNNLYKGKPIDSDKINYLKDYIVSNIQNYESRSKLENIENRFNFIELE